MKLKNKITQLENDAEAFAQNPTEDGLQDIWERYNALYRELDVDGSSYVETLDHIQDMHTATKLEDLGEYLVPGTDVRGALSYQINRLYGVYGLFCNDD